MIPLFLMNYVRSNWRNLVVFALIAGVVFGAYMRGRSDRAKHDAARQAVAEQAALKSDVKADAKATAEQVRAAKVQAVKEGKLIDAVAQAPDSLPDAAAVALGCERLRQAGISTSDVAACGSAGKRP